MFVLLFYRQLHASQNNAVTSVCEHWVITQKCAHLARPLAFRVIRVGVHPYIPPRWRAAVDDADN